jgi:hypothetical protein
MAKWQPGDSWLHYDYREDVSYVYINIPKNASCWMKENFGGYFYDWHKNQFKAPVDSAVTLRRGLQAVKRYLVILRDPVDRWITGFAQSYWGGDPRDPNYFQNQPPNLWIDLIPNDDHVRPQTGFLLGLDLSATTWFDCDRDLTQCFRHWMQARFDQPIKDLADDLCNDYNVSSRGLPFAATGVTQQSIIDRVRQMLIDHPQCRSRLDEIYSADHHLRASVEFYGAR